jgi:hypothetical protein
MSVAASEILDFLEKRQTFTFERHEIASPQFESLRRNLRQIVMKLRESDDNEALEIANAIRILLSECLTTPIIFDKSLENAVAQLFRNGMQLRWGSDIAALFRVAREAAVGLTTIENPVRAKLKEIIQKAHLNGHRFKIYCHRRAKPHFDSLLASLEDISVPDDIFLHSVRDYRDSETFDVLIKVGPLRSKGWGSAPDAIWTAPRFGVLQLIVWLGSNDEPGFGYDPSQPTKGNSRISHSGNEDAYRLPKWSVQRSHTGKDEDLRTLNEADWDELSVFAGQTQFGESRPAKLVQVDEEQGIFYPPQSRVLSFSPLARTREPICWRIPGETLVEGMFVIIPNLEDVNFGDLQAQHGYYSRIWKSRLREEVKLDRDRLVERLRSAGLDLMYLDDAIRHWCREPGTVIHAPQQIPHFEILIRVLGIEDDVGSIGSHSAIPWWKRAWMEIRQSRGEAIQAGQLEQELVDEQLLTVVKDVLATIRDEASRNCAFDLTVPATSGMNGILHFFPVTGIEDGFSVPDAQLRVVHKLSMIDRWRV